jgi:23S rRNA (cytidine1920-2'-O)/16S rRNA (cytidine1409-2'-O)-methyltransferase
MATRRRADILLVERGLFESRAKAQAAIAAGLVTAGDALVRKASDPLAPDVALAAAPAFPWVSRGGVKLAHALDSFGIAAAGRVCLDVGASTGGFTDVLLSRGARLVIAVDVGTAQLHPRLRGRADVRAFEATDIRAFDRAALPAAPDLVVIDVSFISLRLVLPAALALAARPADVVALIKPQFEAPRRAIKKGIVRDGAVHDEVCAGIVDFASSLGCTGIRVTPSPIEGGDGNREFLLGARIG